MLPPWGRLGFGWPRGDLGGSHTLQQSPLWLTQRSYEHRDLSETGKALAQGLTWERDLCPGDWERQRWISLGSVCPDGVTGLLVSPGE